MKFFAPLLLLGALALVASRPYPEAEAEAISLPEPAPDIKLERDVNDATLQKRECIDNSCLCSPGTPQGQYCYGCGAVFDEGDVSVHNSSFFDWVFECNPSGGCCAYGYRVSCSGGAADPCGP